MADARAVAYGERISAVFAGSAESFSLIRSGASTTQRGLFQPMDNASVNLYFDANEAVGLVRPALMVWLEGTVSVLVNDVFFRDRTDPWTVRKVQNFRQGDTVLLILALCD